MPLDSRLQTAADLCRSGVVVADVGTDHAQLACYLAMNGAKAVIASDVREGPLEAARRTVEETGAKGVTVLLSNGLDKIDYADDVVICGMGGELIAKIIEGCRFLSENTRFILQPMTRADHLRRWLYSSGFELDAERTAYDSGRAYVIMRARYTGKKRDIDDIFALVGTVSDKKYLALAAEKLMKNAEGMDRSDGCSEQAEKLRSIARSILSRAEAL